MRFDAVRPARHVREGLVSGQLSELAALPLVLVVVLVYHQGLQWGYLAGALATVFVSLLSFAFFMAVTRGRSGIGAQVMIGFGLACLAVLSLGLVELGTSDSFGTLMPGCLVAVAFISTIGDRAMRIAFDCFAVAVVVVVARSGGLRGDHLAAVTVVYAATIAAITWLISRLVSSSDERVSLRRSIGMLDDALGEIGSGDARSSADLIQEVLRRGLPLVSDVMPAERITVYSRHGHLGRLVSLATWPEGAPEVCEDPGSRPELSEALRSDSVVLGDELCAVPIGYCREGELAMVVRPSAHVPADDRAAEAAEVVAAAFRRATSRVNFVSALPVENPTDALTGLANRRILYERIQIEMEHALRSDSPLSVAMIDLDHFKDYNDRYGPVAGDTVLRSIAAVLVSNIRGQDLVVRYGGEEFCLVMPDTDILGGHHLLDKLRAGGREATSEFGVTLSAGLTSWDGIEDIQAMIERAGQALYRAKESGRDRVVSIQSVTEF